MANGKQKLELTWIGKDVRPKLEPRILIEDPAKSYHAGFRRGDQPTAPSATDYWQHGHSTENDFIFVTTQTLSYEQLAKISEDVGPNRTLLICCGAFRGIKAGDFPNLTVKKIPKAVLSKCEWGHDDYSLEIQNLPMKAPAESNAGILPAPETDGAPAPRDGTPRPRTKAQRRKQAANNSASLFDLAGGKNE
ncbi:MAG: hypothetical protein ACYCUV_06140 [Phycisphaerae bacterium]